MASESRTHSIPVIPVAALALLALLLRLPALLQEPWIDEVWSWGLARSRASAWEALTHSSSNNHPLNSLWIWILGDQRAAWPYRIPALAAGLAAVFVAARIGARHGRAAAIAAAALVAVSYPLTVYTTEARGYGLLVLCALASFESAWTWLDARGRGALVVFWASSAVGVLSQYLFVLCWAAIAAGIVWRLFADRAGRRAAFARAALILAPPAAFFAALWWIVVRHVFNAGAPPWNLATVMEQTFAWSLGLPEAGWSLALGAALATAILALDVRALQARGDAAWVVQIAAVVVLPAAGVLLLRDQYVAPRYFLVPIAFWLLSAARVLGALAARGHGALAAAGLLFLAFAAGNLARTVPFLRVGRGTIGALVQELARRDPSPVVRVAGNYDFNVSALLEWHARALPPGRRIEYVSGKQIPAEGVPFLVVDEPRFTSEPLPRLRVGAVQFELVATDRHYGPCGSDWALYQRR